MWGDFPQTLVEGDRVTYVGGPAAAEWFASRPPQLERDRAETMASGIAALPRAA